MMRAVAAWLRGLRPLLPLTLHRRRRLEREVQAELAFHLEMRRQELVEAGMDPATARGEAARLFGDPTEIAAACLRVHEDHPVRATLRAIESALAVAVVVGLVAALFTLFNAVFYRPPVSFHDDGLRVALWWRADDGTAFEPASSRDEFERLRMADDLFEHVTAAIYRTAVLEGPRGPETGRVKLVTRDYFRLYGARPWIGRTFAPEEEEQGERPVALLSHAFWLRQFAGRRDAVGQTVQIGGRPHRIVGVMPRNLAMYMETAIWVPLPAPARAGTALLVAARLRPDIGIAEAQRRVEQRLSRPRDASFTRPQLRSLRDIYAAPAREPLLGGLVATALLVAAALAHVVQRRVTTARGEGTRPRAARFVRWAEAVAVVACASWAGIAASGPVAAWLSPRLIGSVAPLFDARVDSHVIAVALVIAAGTLGLLLLRASRVDSEWRRRARPWLLGLQVAVALVLTLAAWPAVKRYWTALQAEPGFDTTAVQVFDVAFAKPDDWSERRRTAARLVAHLEEVGGVEAVTFAHAFPSLDRAMRVLARDPGRPDWSPVRFAVVAADYHLKMKIPLLAGRRFRPEDRQGETDVVIVNATLAGRRWPGQSALGKTLELHDIDKTFTVVGVVGDVRQGRPEQPVEPVIYRPFSQYAGVDTVTFVVRGTVDAETLLAAARDELQPLNRPVPASRLVAGARAGLRFRAVTLGALAAVAVLLAFGGCLGLALERAERASRRGDVAWRACAPVLLGVTSGGLSAGAWLAHRLAILDVPWVRDAASIDVPTAAIVGLLTLLATLITGLAVARYVETAAPSDTFVH